MLGSRCHRDETRIEPRLHLALVREEATVRRERTAITPRVAIVVDADDEAVSDFHGAGQRATGVPQRGFTKTRVFYVDEVWRTEKSAYFADDEVRRKCDGAERGRPRRSANLLVRVVAAGAFHAIRPHVRRLAAAALIHHLLASTMAGHSAFAAGFTCFLAGPLVGRALLVRRLAPLAGNFSLLGPVH